VRNRRRPPAAGRGRFARRAALALAGAPATALATVLCAAPSAPAAARSSHVAPPGAHVLCGPAARETLARTVGRVARQIYLGERFSSEVRADRRQVERNAPLLRALADREPVAIRQAVTSLVFSHTHIVRLRVTRGSTVLADVGGPDVLAPVGGPLRLGGRAVGRYLLSVQDDLGYVKLVTRFVGVPLLLQRGSRQLSIEGTVVPAPPRIPDHGPLRHHGVDYETFSFTAAAFPRGRLRVVVLAPVSASLASMSCAEIRTAALGRVARRVWRRYVLDRLSPGAYVHAIDTFTGGLSYVRRGSHQLAGSTSPGPRRLPRRGRVRYRHRRYLVSSFRPAAGAGRVRVYLLVPVRPQRPSPSMPRTQHAARLSRAPAP
jgi:hypothetical protein